MQTLRRRFRPAAWLALVVLVTALLLPTLSHAMARAAGQGSSGFTEVCTPQGSKRVALNDGEAVPDSTLLPLPPAAQPRAPPLG